MSQIKLLVIPLVFAAATAHAGGVYNNLSYKDCAAGGPTAGDAALATQLSPQIHTPRNRGLDAGQMQCARVITETALARGLGERGAIIAVTTALAETALHDNIESAATEGTSLGLYQQIASWGPAASREDAVWSTNAFFDLMLQRNSGGSWRSGDIGAICESVQESQAEAAYDPEAGAAALIVTALRQPPAAQHGNLIANGDFNRNVAGWHRSTAHTNLVRATANASTSPAEGTGYLATNTSDGGSVSLDTPLAIAAGETFCVSAQLTTVGSGSGGAGTLAVWLIGGSANDGSSKHVTGLPGHDVWTPVRTCVTAGGAHTVLRVELYPLRNGPTLGLDAVDVSRSLVPNGGFNDAAAGWARSGTTNFARYDSSAAYEGSGYLATNTTSSGGSVYTDVARTIAAGDTYCVSAELAALGASTGRATLAIWMLGGTTEGSAYHFGELAGGTWSPGRTCVTATAAHSAIRVQVYPEAHGATVGIDAVDLVPDLVPTAGWSHSGATTHVVYSTGSGPTHPYEGSTFLATNTATAGGSVLRDVSVAIHAGDSYCVSAALTTANATGGGGATLALWMLGGTTEGSNKAIGSLPGDNVWTDAAVCATATSDHSTLRIQVYPATGGPTIGIDAVVVH